jgi:hypothetical protein
MLFQRDPGTTGLRLETPNEADADHGTPEADHPVMINLSLAALLQVDILVGLARRVGSAVNPRGAVHDAINLSARPVRAPSGQIRGQGTQIKPAPAWGPTAAQTPRRSTG